MSGSMRMRVAVAVATVWTSPGSPRPLDAPATGKPADIEGWLASMTVEDKLNMSEANRVQTQILYGTEVIVSERSGEWADIRIPDQTTSKDPLGYPGWVPLRQLSDASGLPADAWAEVIAPRTELRFHSGAAPIKLSFLTRLPVVKAAEQEIVVDTPDGAGVLPAKDVRIVRTRDAGIGDPDGVPVGQRIVDQSMRFVGLPYLWGGMSAFGYDCSGFAYNMCKSQGIFIPRDASDQAREGREIESEALEPGDLLFFAHDKGRGRIHHVGIYAGDGRMLHAPDSRSRIELVELKGFKLAEEHCISRRYWN